MSNVAESRKMHDEMIKDVTNELQNTLIRKNHDYGDSFSKRFERHGLLSALIRIEDKFARFDNLIDKQKEADESIEDTLLDLAGYSILTIIELRKNRYKGDSKEK